MSQGFHLFVIIITFGSIAGCLWLLFSQSRGTPGEDTGHVWDGDLKENNNPLPRWWLNLFILTAVFGVGYLYFYPGLGNTSGKLGWSSQQEMQARLDELTASRQAAFARLKDKSIDELAADSGAQALGKAVFLANCAGCHGPDAMGARGYPNLVDHDWLYGGDAATVQATITHGRNGQMPAFNGSLAPEAVDALVAFIPHWSDPALPASVREAGMKTFSVTCAACHGPEGKGNPLLGAPNLSDDIWLWGGTRKAVRETILFGRQNHMPAHDVLINADEIRVAAAYIKSLAAPVATASP